MQSNSLIVKNLSLCKGKKLLIDNLSFDLKIGELGLLIGKSNSGKTVLVNLLLAYLPDNIFLSSGEIYFYNENKPINLLTSDSKELDLYRKNITGVVLQNFSIFNEIQTIYKQILNIVYWKSNKKKFQIKKELDELLNFFNFSMKSIHKNSIKLKDSEEIILNLIIQLLIKPKILIIDDIFTGMDLILQNKIIFLLNSIKKDSLIFITSSNKNLLEVNFYDKVIFINE